MSLLLVAGAVTVVVAALARAAQRHAHRLLRAGMWRDEYGVWWWRFRCSCDRWEVEASEVYGRAPSPTIAATTAHGVHREQVGIVTKP